MSKAGKEAAAPSILIDAIAESRTNPRKEYDPVRMKELEESIRRHGVMQPVLLRPAKTGYELVLGHRRFRAAKAAGLKEIPAIVRDLKDDEVLELQLTENLQRSDLHPLEEADGYWRLAHEFKHPVEEIAARVGKSKAYVYDRTKLHDLTADARKAFLRNRITVSHAVLLARLKPADQARAMDPDAGGLFRSENLLFSPDPKDDDGEDPYTTNSVGEFQAWIDEHVRFDTAQVDQMIFPETAEVVEAANAEEAKVLAITHEYQVPPDARAAGKVLTHRAWKRADGKKKSKVCEHARPAVIVIGYGRGEAFSVCTAKEKCKVHWGAEQKERAKRRKQMAAGGAAKKESGDYWARENAKRDAERKRVDAARARWKKAGPAILEAIAARLESIPATPGGILGKFLIAGLRGYRQADKAAAKYSTPGKTPEDLVRFLVLMIVCDDMSEWNVHERLPKTCGELGVNWKKLLDEHAPAPKEEKKPDPKAERKAKAKAKGKK